MWKLCTFRESVVMLIDGFLAVTAVLDPHLLFLAAGPPDSNSRGPPGEGSVGVVPPTLATEGLLAAEGQRWISTDIFQLLTIRTSKPHTARERGQTSRSQGI